MSRRKTCGSLDILRGVAMDITGKVGEHRRVLHMISEQQYRGRTLILPYWLEIVQGRIACLLDKKGQLG